MQKRKKEKIIKIQQNLFWEKKNNNSSRELEKWRKRKELDYNCVIKAWVECVRKKILIQIWGTKIKFYYPLHLGLATKFDTIAFLVVPPRRGCTQQMHLYSRRHLSTKFCSLFEVASRETRRIVESWQTPMTPGVYSSTVLLCHLCHLHDVQRLPRDRVK